MSTTTVLFLLFFLATTHSKPLPLPLRHVTSPYLSPSTISANYDAMVKNFKIFVYKPNPPLTFTSPLESLFYTSLLDSDVTTNVSADAHLFFLPFPPDLPTRSLARVLKSIRTDFPFWNRTLGADHFYLSCSGIGYDSPDRGLVELKKNSIQISCFPTQSPANLIPHKDITLPPLAASHAPTLNTTSFLAYTKSGWVKDNVIIHALRNSSDFLIESPSDQSSPRIYAERLSSSKFCIFDYDGGDVSGIGEALRFGCVPVVIVDRPIVDLPFMDVLRWQEMAMFVGRRGLAAEELKEVLVRACWERHEQMRRLGMAAGQHLAWNAPPRKFDAFHTLVYQLWLRRHTIRYFRQESARYPDDTSYIGIYFKKALFVPNTSVYHKVGSHPLPPADPQVDLSWQFSLPRAWESLMGNKGSDDKIPDASEELRDDMEMAVKNWENSAVFSTLPSAIKWLRDSVRHNQSTRFQVLVTGLLHLVGDVLR